MSLLHPRLPFRTRSISVAIPIALTLLLCSAWWTSAAAAETVSVRVNPTGQGPPVPRRFLGLSFEASALPAVARGARRGNLVTLLRSLGPGMLRFGGLSADTNTAFSARGGAPSWATTRLTPRHFELLRDLARRTGWRVLLTLPLGHFDPHGAAREAAAAARALGPALAAVEIGNEPNVLWMLGARPQSYDYAQYIAEIGAYSAAIAARVPGVRIAGPDIVPEFDGSLWTSAFARDVRPALLTVHYYALNGCTQPYATVADLLGPIVAAREMRTISSFAAIARDYDLPMRLGETNNVACRGKSGVSDTFGAALWALRYMLALARAGIAGVNFHTLHEECDGYSAICASSRADYRRGRLRTMPEWYALLLFRHLIGARPARISLTEPPDGLTVDAFNSKRGVEVVAVNTTPGVDVSLTIRRARRRAIRSAVVLPLTAPDLVARSGVRLGRARVSTRGTWRPRQTKPLAPARSRAFRVVVPGASAVLVRLAD